MGRTTYATRRNLPKGWSRKGGAAAEAGFRVGDIIVGIIMGGVDMETTSLPDDPATGMPIFDLTT
jgi:hypothetical protein